MYSFIPFSFKLFEIGEPIRTWKVRSSILIAHQKLSKYVYPFQYFARHETFLKCLINVTRTGSNSGVQINAFQRCRVRHSKTKVFRYFMMYGWLIEELLKVFSNSYTQLYWLKYSMQRHMIKIIIISTCVTRKAFQTKFVTFLNLTLLGNFPFGLVVTIPGSHPGGPGSIPGVGKCFFFLALMIAAFLALMGVSRSNRNFIYLYIILYI